MRGLIDIWLDFKWNKLIFAIITIIAIALMTIITTNPFHLLYNKIIIIILYLISKQYLINFM